MKVLQITRQFFPSIGGIENVVYGLSKELATKISQVDILTLRYLFNTKETISNYSEIDQLRVFRIKHFGIRRYPIALGILKYLPVYDILHIHAVDFFVDFLSLTRFLHKKPIVLTTHGGIFHTSWLSSFKNLYFRSITRLSLNSVDAVVCISKHDYELFKPIVPENKLFIIPNGVCIEPFLNVEKEIQQGLLLGIGRVVENKSIDKLIWILSILVKEYPDTTLVWIGNDQEGLVKGLLSYADRLGVSKNIEFLGKVSDRKMLSLISKANFFVSSASYESFGVSTIEAMGSATVPIVSPVGVHGEVIQHGETGFICDFDNGQVAVDCFLNALTLRIEDVNEMGLRARESSKAYSWNTVSTHYENLYKHILFTN